VGTCGEDTGRSGSWSFLNLLCSTESSVLPGAAASRKRILHTHSISRDLY
jgi:hypothetical protein